MSENYQDNQYYTPFLYNYPQEYHYHYHQNDSAKLEEILKILKKLEKFFDDMKDTGMEG